MRAIALLKELMYAQYIDLDHRFTINDIIYELDKERSSTPFNVLNAGKEWEYRLHKLCDYLASKNLKDEN